MTDTAVETSTTIERYLQFWNTESVADQEAVATVVFTDDVVYLAPLGVLHGASEMMAFRNEFARNMGAVELRLRAEPEVLPDRARLRWELMVRDAPFAEGSDVIVFDETGRISSISAFVDRAPDGFDPHAQVEVRDHARPRPEGRW
jgi:hypothetical protein